MQRVLTPIGAFFGTVVTSMLWFLLLFGDWNVVCGNRVQSLFVAGSTQFAVIAGVWGLIVVGLILTPSQHPLRFVLWAVGGGSWYQTLYRSAWTWIDGVNLAVTALVAILLMQTLTLLYLYSGRLKLGQLRLGLRQWVTLALPGLLGVLLTDLGIGTVPCVPGVGYSDPLTGAPFGSTLWYVAWALVPTLVTAALYTAEAPSVRS